MRHLIVTTAMGLVIGCFVSGCGRAQQPPAQLGGPAPGPSVSSPTTNAATPGYSSNAGLTSGRLASAISAATGQAAALHLTGTNTAGATTLTLNVQLNGDGTSSGTLGYLGAVIPFRVYGGTDYFQLTPSFMRLTKMNQISAQGEWVTSTSSYGDPLATVFSQFLTFNGFVGTNLADSGRSAFTFVSTGRLGTQRIAAYHEQDSTGPTVTYYIAASGPALPLRIFGGDSDIGADLTLVWNQPTTVPVLPASQIYTG